MRKALWLLAPGAIIAAVFFVATREAAATGEEASPSAARFARIDRSLLDSTGPQEKFVPASMSDRPMHVVLELSGEPVAVHSRNAKNQGSRLTSGQKDAIRQQLRGQQNTLHGPLANAGATIRAHQYLPSKPKVAISVPLKTAESYHIRATLQPLTVIEHRLYIHQYAAP